MILSVQLHRICRPLIEEVVFNRKPWRANPVETKPPMGGIEEIDQYKFKGKIVHM
jgi:hypothetical protein